MARVVYVPELGRSFSFKDGATDQEVSSFFQSAFPAPAEPAQAPAPPGPDESGILGRLAYGFGRGLTDVPGGIASLLYPAEEAAQTAAGQFSESARKYLQETFGIDPTKDPTAAQQAAEALGSVASFLVPGSAVAKGVGLAGKTAAAAGRAGAVTAGAQGVALGAESRAETIRGQLASGMTISEEDQLAAQRLSGLIGASEALPLNKFFGPITQLLGKVPVSQAPALNKIVQSRLGRIARAGLEEGAQEAAAGIANDIMEYGIYNPNVEIGQDILSNAGTGAFAGSFVEGLIQLAAGRKVRPFRELQSDLVNESRQNYEKVRLGKISQAAENLRQTGVQGSVNIEEDIFDGLPVFNIKAPDGKTIAQFTDSDGRAKDSAIAAVSLYSKNTGVKVEPNIIPKVPEASAETEIPELQVDFDTEIKEPPPAPGMTRVYHSGARGEGETGRWVSTNKTYASDYRRDLPLFYTDIPSDDPRVSPDPLNPDQGVKQGFTFNFELAPKEAAKLRRIKRDEKPKDAPVETPIGAVEAIETPAAEQAVVDDAVAPDQANVTTEFEAPEAEMSPVESAAPEVVQDAPSVSPSAAPSVSQAAPEVSPESVQAAADVTPKSLGEAYAAGPKIAAPTKEVSEKFRNVYETLMQRLAAIAPPDVTLGLREFIDTESPDVLIKGFHNVEKSGGQTKSVIDLATGIYDPDLTTDQLVGNLLDVLNHEVIHALRRNGLIRPAEWRILSRAVTEANVPGRKYTYLDKAQAVYNESLDPSYADQDAVIEEAVAELYKDWVRSGKAPVQTRGLLNRITEFFRRIFRTLRDNKYEDVFKAIESGEIKGREPIIDLEAETRLSAAPVLTAGTQDPSGRVEVRPFPEVNEGSSSVYLRRDFGKTKTSGRVRDKAWGEALDRAFLQKFGRQFDINNPQDYEHIVASISDEIRHQMKQAQSGVGWYDSDIQDVFDELSKSFPVLKDPGEGPVYRQIFTLIAGVMSNGMKAKANVELAAINFAHFLRTGQFSPIHPFTKTGWNQRSNIMGPQITMLNSMVADPRFAPRPGSNNPELERYENFLRFMFTEHSVREINQFRAMHGTKSPAKIGKIDDRRLGMYAFGPKFGPFILNLNGLSDETVDSWASRSFYRHMGKAIGADGELIQAPMGRDREAMKRALRDVGAATNLSSRDIQAVLWFYEKELFNQLGQKIPLEVFSDGAKEFTRKYGAGSGGSLESRTDRERAISGSIEDAGARYSAPLERKQGTPRFSAAPALNTDEFKRWFGNSKVVNEDGSPKVQYHGTNVSYRNFKQFDTGLSELGTHFGTQAQANEFVKDVPPDPDEDATIVNDRVYPVYLSIQNPLRMQDANRWSTGRMARRLRDMGFLNPEEAATVEKMPINHITAIRMLQDAIRKAGYDGVVYLNRSEGIPTKVDPNDKLDMSDDDFRAKYGAEDSYIVFSPEQVKSVFNQFPYGEAESPRFSAAPMSPYLQAQNDSMFAEPPKLSFSEKIFDYIFGYKPYSREHMRVAVRANLVDKTAAITHLEKKLNLRDNNIFDRYVADYSATAAITQRRRASHLTASTIMMGNPKVNFADPGNILSATLSVEENPDSIMKIAEILTNSGPIDPATGLPQDLSNVFRTYATAIRGRDLRAKGLAVPRYITPQYVNESLTSIPRDYPQVVEAYDMYQRYNKRLMEAARDSGLFSDAEFSRLTRDSNYYGFYRELYQEELAPTATTKTAGEFKFREYKGSEEGGLINDPLFVIIRNSQFLIESMAKNIATTKSYDVARRMGEAQLLARGQDPDLSQGFQKDIMYFKDKGVLKRFAVKDPLLVTALGSDDRVVLGKAIDLLGMPASILRETVTRDPAFMVANLLRDTVSSWITSGEDITPFIGTAKGMVSAYKQSASFKTLMGRGVVGSYDMAMMEPTDIANTIRRRTMPKNIHTVTSISGATGAIQSLWDRLGQLSEASDAATRIAVYEAARRQGMSEAEASLRAVEIMDFSRRGASHLLNIMTKTIPFLNARIQGLDVLYQSMVSGKRFIMGQSVGERDANIGRRFLVRGAMLAAISIALEMYNQDDEDYKQLDSYIKDGNLLFPLRDFGMPGEFIAIPKPFEAGLLFSTFPQTMYKYFVSDQASNRDVANLFFSQFASTFGVNPLPQILIPPLEIITNHDFYTGLPLISEGKLRLDPSLQYDSRTSTVAMMISNIPFVYDVNTGEFRGPSPIAVDQLISGYTGPLGSYIAMAVGAAMSGFDAGPERMPAEISQAPVIRRFFVDAEAKNPAVVTQAYELFRIVDEANRTFSRLRQANDAEALLDYYEERKDVLAYKKYIFKLVDRLNKLSAYERQIERDKELTDEEKIAAKRNIREMRIRVAAQVSEINKKLGR